MYVRTTRTRSPKPLAPHLNLPLLRVTALLLLIVAGIGCASGPRALDYTAATSRAMADSDYNNMASRSQTLAAMDVITVASIAGEPHAIAEAIGVIEENAGASRGALAGAISMATLEGARRYIGETYERSYASIVGGWAYWTMGQYENAAALWRNASMIDGESDEGYRTDLGPANYLLAKWYYRKGGSGDLTNANIYRQRFLNSHPRAAHFVSDDALNRHNLVILLENGYAPLKTATGPQGSILEYGAEHVEFAYATVTANGRNLGRSMNIYDSRSQAVHSLRPNAKVVWQALRGTAVAAGVGYGVYKLTDDPALGVFAAAFLQLLPADLRQWRGVPAELHLISAALPPGLYDIQINFVTNRGDESILRTEFERVGIDDRYETIILARPLPGVNKRRLPIPGAKPKIFPDAKARARPDAPTIFPSGINPEEWEKSPIYRYLPDPPTVREKGEARRQAELQAAP